MNVHMHIYANTHTYTLLHVISKIHKCTKTHPKTASPKKKVQTLLYFLCHSVPPRESTALPCLIILASCHPLPQLFPQVSIKSSLTLSNVSCYIRITFLCTYMLCLLAKTHSSSSSWCDTYADVLGTQKA